MRGDTSLKSGGSGAEYYEVADRCRAVVAQPVELARIEDRTFARLQNLLCLAQFKRELALEHVHRFAASVLMRRVRPLAARHLGNVVSQRFAGEI